LCPVTGVARYPANRARTQGAACAGAGVRRGGCRGDSAGGSGAGRGRARIAAQGCL